MYEIIYKKKDEYVNYYN